jgi:hypothetical protein
VGSLSRSLVASHYGELFEQFLRLFPIANRSSLDTHIYLQAEAKKMLMQGKYFEFLELKEAIKTRRIISEGRDLLLSLSLSLSPLFIDSHRPVDTQTMKL